VIVHVHCQKERGGREETLKRENKEGTAKRAGFCIHIVAGERVEEGIPAREIVHLYRRR
jgi:hypothetical protein